MIGKAWQTEPREIRAHYKAKADLKKAEHLLKYPGYSYRPRKSSEKKRRMSKKKALAAKLLEHKGALDAALDYVFMPQQTGGLAGNVGGVRAATLPLSVTASDEIMEHNETYATTMDETLASPFNLIPNAEYAAVQAADEHVVTLALEADHFNSFINAIDFDDIF